jgi:hypothetical protein
MRTAPLSALAILIVTASWAGVFPASGQSATNGQGSSAVAEGSLPDRVSSSLGSPMVTSAIPDYHPIEVPIRPFSSVGIETKISSLGVGVEVATPLSRSTNLRAGFNLFGYSQTFTSEGMTYASKLNLSSVETLVDWYPFKGSFHISPGAMIDSGNQVKANLSVPGSSYFTLNGTSYLSDPANPVTGAGTLKFNSAAPMLLAGWGNLVPRSKHFSFPVEAGVAFQGSPHTALNLTGDVCDSSERICLPISDDPHFQNDVAALQTRLSNDVSALKYYPVVSLGFAYRFSMGSRSAY